MDRESAQVIEKGYETPCPIAHWDLTREQEDERQSVIDDLGAFLVHLETSELREVIRYVDSTYFEQNEG